MNRSIVMTAVAIAMMGVPGAVFADDQTEKPQPRFLTVDAVIGTGIFILASLLLLANALVEKPVESVIGLILIAAGLPAYAWWRRHPTPDSGEQT